MLSGTAAEEPESTARQGAQSDAGAIAAADFVSQPV